MDVHAVQQIRLDRIEPNTWNPNEMDERMQSQLAVNVRGLLIQPIAPRAPAPAQG